MMKPTVEFECRNCACTFTKDLKNLGNDGICNCVSCGRLCKSINGTASRDVMVFLVLNYLSEKVKELEDRNKDLERKVESMKFKEDDLEGDDF